MLSDRPGHRDHDADRAHAARPAQDLRAAAFGPAVRFHASERALLREAASRHPELADLRAGARDFGPSPRDIMVILSALTAVAVVLSWIL